MALAAESVINQRGKNYVVYITFNFLTFVTYK